MNAETVTALAAHLAQINEDWRRAAGYTGRPIHRRAYWRNMAACLLAGSLRAVAEARAESDDEPPTTTT